MYLSIFIILFLVSSQDHTISFPLQQRARMEDQVQQCYTNPPSKQETLGDKSEPDRVEPARSRWTPKPEQILILESIFNSGMVNPPKDETVRIRKLLEKFGSVGDANVFYWFQNRRSRSRRRQRQMQAASIGGNGGGGEQKGTTTTMKMTEGRSYGVGGGDGIQYESGGGACSSSSGFLGFISNNSNNNTLPSLNIPVSSVSCSSSNFGVLESLECVDHDIFSFSDQMGHPEIGLASSVSSSPLVTPSDSINFQYQPVFISVFINGVATEVPKGPLDMKTMVGQDYLLLHSSGLPVPVNEYGFLMESLQHGESYYVVPRPF